MPRVLLTAVALAIASASAAVHAAPCAGFTDVDDASAFCVNVAWMKNRGITLGCTATLYCPADYVTRLQMAAFMYRLGVQNAFLQGGNAFGATAVLGTDDAQAVEVHAGNARVVRYEPSAVSPNVIGGSPANTVTAGVRGATIGGGGVPAGIPNPDFGGEAPNRVTDAYGTVGGGYANRAGDGAGTTTDRPFATVGGGANNRAEGRSSTVSGGGGNVASDRYGVVGGGNRNTASAYASSVGGGEDNTASGLYSAVGGGLGNLASFTYATVAGGVGNQAIGIASFAAGSGNVALGFGSVAIGVETRAQGATSVALGRNAKTLGDGSFQFADAQPFDYSSGTDNAFRVRATGGVRFTTGIDAAGNTTWSCLTTDGNGWSCASDRALKHGLVALDGAAVLAKLAAMPVYQWQPKGANAHVKHFGPMAQDFHAAFGLGDDERMIGLQDADGVALAAIQGLNAKLEARIAEQAREIADLRRLDERLAAGAPLHP